MPQDRIDLILLGGASGSGKSHLAVLHGKPHLPLDDFYRAIDEDCAEAPFPRTAYGQIDWDHPGTWNLPAALDSVERLLADGSTMVPNYSISVSRADGHREVSCTGGPVVAEGIFVLEALHALRERGLNVHAYFIDEAPLITAVRRFARDVHQRRKPVGFLLKRGYALYRAHGQVRESYRAAGFKMLTKTEVKRRLEQVSPH